MPVSVRGVPDDKALVFIVFGEPRGFFVGKNNGQLAVVLFHLERRSAGSDYLEVL